jgi:hypothetical protein
LISHSFPVPVSRWLQVSLLASQLTESAAGGSPVESLQSHMILTMSHWSSGLTCLISVTRDPGSIPQGGYLCETGILLLALSSCNTGYYKNRDFLLFLNTRKFIFKMKKMKNLSLGAFCQLPINFLGISIKFSIKNFALKMFFLFILDHRTQGKEKRLKRKESTLPNITLHYFLIKNA